MSTKHRISYERLLTSLLNTGSVKETAEELSISTRTVYTMMSESEFKELYCHSQADILNTCIIEMQGHLLEAVKCIAEIMNDSNVNPQIRLQSANSIIKHTLSMYEKKECIRSQAEEKGSNYYYM